MTRTQFCDSVGLGVLIRAHKRALEEGGELRLVVSGLSFADSAAMQTLALAARTMKERGGTLVLLHPQPAVARLLALTGAEQVSATRGRSPA